MQERQRRVLEVNNSTDGPTLIDVLLGSKLREMDPEGNPGKVLRPMVPWSMGVKVIAAAAGGVVVCALTESAVPASRASSAARQDVDAARRAAEWRVMAEPV
jgi:hypothetical protein